MEVNNVRATTVRFWTIFNYDQETLLKLLEEIKSYFTPTKLKDASEWATGPNSRLVFFN